MLVVLTPTSCALLMRHQQLQLGSPCPLETVMGNDCISYAISLPSIIQNQQYRVTSIDCEMKWLGTAILYRVILTTPTLEGASTRITFSECVPAMK